MVNERGTSQQRRQSSEHYARAIGQFLRPGAPQFLSEPEISLLQAQTITARPPRAAAECERFYHLVEVSAPRQPTREGSCHPQESHRGASTNHAHSGRRLTPRGREADDKRQKLACERSQLSRETETHIHGRRILATALQHQSQ